MITNRAVLAAALLLAVACGKDEGAGSTSGGQAANASGGNGNGNGGAGNGGATKSGASGQPGGPGGGRPVPSVTLAASDIATVRRDTIEEGIAITGDLRPIETVEVRARLEGDLVGVLVREGERVREGQTLARFESSEQESGLSSAQADRVAAESELATATWNLEQTTELFRAGAVSERDFKAAQQTVTTAKARVAAAQSRVRATSSLVRDTRVLAPTGGVISRKLVENGEHVSRGAGLFTLVRSDVLELAAAVPARQANAVSVGQTVRFVADGRSFGGKVARVSPTVDPTTRSVAVYIQIPNATGSLKGGTFASGRVVSRVIPGAIVVPASAIRQSVDEGRPYVFRITGKVIDIAMISVGVVDERAGMAEVTDGLAIGDRVVAGNVGVLGRGMQVVVAGEERQGGQRGPGSGARPTP